MKMHCGFGHWSVSDSSTFTAKAEPVWMESHSEEFQRRFCLDDEKTSLQVRGEVARMFVTHLIPNWQLMLVCFLQSSTGVRFPAS